MNGILLDTHTFLWWVADDPRLSAKARTTVTNADDVFLSVASCWEMAIKVSLEKLTLPRPVDRFVSEHLGLNQFALLPVDLEHASRVAALPFHHRDPFDRLLVAQAQIEDLTILTADPVFDAYDVVSKLMSLGQRPAVFVVDRDGVVRFDSIGTQQWEIPSNDNVLAVLSSL